MARRLSPSGQWNDSIIGRFNQTAEKCQWDPRAGLFGLGPRIPTPGLYVRSPGEGSEVDTINKRRNRLDFEAWDDYFALAAASYVCDPAAKIARDILTLGLSTGFWYGALPNYGFFDEWAKALMDPIRLMTPVLFDPGAGRFHARSLWARPWLPVFIAVAAHQPDLLDRIPALAASAEWLILDVTVTEPVKIQVGGKVLVESYVTGAGLIRGSQDRPEDDDGDGGQFQVDAWMQLLIADDKGLEASQLGRRVQAALGDFRKRYYRKNPQGMADALKRYGYGRHPLYDAFMTVPVPQEDFDPGSQAPQGVKAGLTVKPGGGRL